MAAIGRKLALLAAAFVMAAFADAHSDVMDLFGSMASALTNNNPAGFMSACDKSMPNFGKLRGFVEALVLEGDLISSIDAISDEGDESRRTIDLDWTLQIRSREGAGPLVQRDQTIHVVVVKDKKRWHIVSLSPIEFFEPARLSPSK